MNGDKTVASGIARRISMACAALVMAAGAIVLLGWALQLEALKCILPGTVSMKANTALGFLAAGLSLLIYNLSGPENTVKLRLARALAFFTALLGLATLSQYLFGWNLGIDQLLFLEPAGAVATFTPGRMAPVTALDFVFCGVALALLELDSFARLGQALALLMGLSGLAALAGYAYGVEALEGQIFLAYTKMAVNTALSFVVLSLGLLFLRQGKGLLSLFAGRRLPAGLLTIFAAGFILPVAGHILVSLFFAGAVWTQAPFHSAIETINACAALLMSWLIFWLLKKGELEPDYSFVPHALVSIGLLEGLHACVSPGNAFIWLHTASAILGGLFFSLSWLSGGKAPRLRGGAFLASAGGVLALGILMISFGDRLPPLIKDGKFTGLEQALNITGGLIYLAAAVRFTLIYLRGSRLEAGLFSAFCLLGAWTGALFHYTSVYRSDWWYWHFLRVTAHGILLSYMFIAFRRMVAREREAEVGRLAAEEASRTKSEFLSNMSHELRTPLNSIIGFTEALEDRLFGPLNAKQVEYVGLVLGSGRHLLNLVNDILDLSKVEAGKMDFEPAKLSVKELLISTNALFATKTLERGLALKLELEPAADIEIEADGRKLKQIMFNLLSNAVKFTPDGGGITVRAGIDGGRGLEISVADTGIGIEAQDLPKLFTEFTQLTAGYTRSHEGTGLGLALTRRFVEMHGGEIRADSAGLGKGATFTFKLPAGGADIAIEKDGGR